MAAPSASSLVTGLIAGAALGVGACAAFQAWRAGSEPQENQSAEKKSPKPQHAAAPTAPRAPLPSPEIFEEHCERTKLFFGEDRFAHIRRAFVVVVGLGGVGSMAAIALARTGVRKMRLIDPDMVTVSSLNRHAVATRADVGKPKVLAIAEHVRAIVPEVEIEPVESFFTASLAEQLLAGSPDLVLDCIDDSKTKVELLHGCVTRGIRVVSSFGVGACVDPSRIRALDISETYACPLGRRIRRSLAKLGVATGITCVFSTEVDRRELAALSEEEHERLESQQISRQVRVRAVPSFMPLPAIAGLALADVGLCMLAGLPYTFDGGDSAHSKKESKDGKGTPAAEGEAAAAAAAAEEEEVDVTPAHARRVLSEFITRESRRAHKSQGDALRAALPPEQALYVVRDVWSCKSALSGKQLRPKQMALAVLDREKSVSRANVVLLSKDEVEEFDARAKPLEEEVAKRIAAVLEGITGSE